jgi:hypothetical protein
MLLDHQLLEPAPRALDVRLQPVIASESTRSSPTWRRAEAYDPLSGSPSTDCGFELPEFLISNEINRLS